jgi:hypothetical protein
MAKGSLRNANVKGGLKGDTGLQGPPGPAAAIPDPVAVPGAISTDAPIKLLVAGVSGPNADHSFTVGDMVGVHFASVTYAGLKEDLSFSTDSMRWTAGTETARYP